MKNTINVPSFLFEAHLLLIKSWLISILFPRKYSSYFYCYQSRYNHVCQCKYRKVYDLDLYDL